MTSTQQRFDLERHRLNRDVLLAIAQAYGAVTSAGDHDHAAAALESMVSLLKGAHQSRINEVETEKFISKPLEIEASHFR